MAIIRTSSVIPTTISKAPVPILADPVELPVLVINERTMTFRMDSRTAWNRFALGVINYSVSTIAETVNTPNVERNLYRNSSLIGDYFTPYYGITAGTKIGDYLISICKTTIAVVGVIKQKQTDITIFQNTWGQQIGDLAQYLNSLNPGQYPVDLLAELLTNLTIFWTKDFIARVNNDFAADAVALDNVLKVAVTGIPDHANQGYSSIADVLSRGIIAQFPLSFIG